MEQFKKQAVKNVLNGLQAQIHELSRKNGEWLELEGFDYTDDEERLEAISAADIHKNITLCQASLEQVLTAADREIPRQDKKHPASTELGARLADTIFYLFDLAEAAGCELGAGIISKIKDYKT